MINNFFNNNLLNSSIEENHDINEIYILCQQENNDFQIDEGKYLEKYIFFYFLKNI